MKLTFTLLSLLFCATPLVAQDLTKVDRALAKEPAYQSKQPKYCLLVFGPEAKHRVWLVQDGGLLYVDRNGNGDLTEAGERVSAAKGDSTNATEGMSGFEVGDIPEGKLLHKDLGITIFKLDDLAKSDERIKQHLAKHPDARGYSMRLDVEMPGYKSTGLGGRVPHGAGYQDVQGILTWGNTPQTAPIIHFRGPRHLLMESPVPLTVGRVSEIFLKVGTPGVGPGTAAYLGYEGVVPEKLYPVIEITYPPQRSGEPPLKEHYELKERC